MTIEFKVAEEDILSIQRGNSEKKINRVLDEVLSLINGEMTGLTEFFDNSQTTLPEIVKKVQEEKSTLLKNFTNKETIGNEIKKYLKEIFEQVASTVDNQEVIKINNDLNGLLTDKEKIQTNIAFYTDTNKYFFDIMIFPKEKNFFIFSIPIKKGKKITTSFGKSIKQEKLILDDCSKMRMFSSLSKEKKIYKSLNENKEIFFEIIKKIDIEKLYKMQQVIHSYYIFNESIRSVDLRNFIKEDTAKEKVFNNAEDIIKELYKTKDIADLNKDMKVNLITIEDLNNIVG